MLKVLKKQETFYTFSRFFSKRKLMDGTIAVLEACNTYLEIIDVASHDKCSEHDGNVPEPKIVLKLVFPVKINLPIGFKIILSRDQKEYYVGGIPKEPINQIILPSGSLLSFSYHSNYDYDDRIRKYIKKIKHHLPMEIIFWTKEPLIARPIPGSSLKLLKDTQLYDNENIKILEKNILATVY